MPDLRHRSPRRAARRRADQRHGRARARFRRCQQFDGRPSLGADRAGAVRARGNPRQHRARIHRRLCRRVRDRDPHRPWRQSASLRKGLAPDRDAGRVRRGRCLLSSDGSGPRENRAGAGDRRLARVGHQGQFRYDDQAAACRAYGAQRPVRRPARARGVYRQRRRARTQAGISARVQRRRQLRCRCDPRRLGAALRHRLSRNRHQNASVLRQHAPGSRCNAGAACRTRHRAGQGGAHRIRGRIRAASPIPTGPTRKPASTRNSACNTASHAPCSAAASFSSISRARRSATRRRGR